MEEGVAVAVEDADVTGARVQVDPPAALMRLGVESGGVLLGEGCGSCRCCTVAAVRGRGEAPGIGRQLRRGSEGRAGQGASRGDGRRAVVSLNARGLAATPRCFGQLAWIRFKALQPTGADTGG